MPAMKSSGITIVRGDITKIAADAIVNAANSSLMGGGGVDGAIHRAGGPQILEECKKIVESTGPCPPGKAVITTAGNLPAKFIIHTVGPVWRGGRNNEETILADCYLNSLGLANEHECLTVAFPNISTGAYGFPKDLAARVAIHAVQSFMEMKSKPENVIFVCFDEENFHLMQNASRVL